MQTKCDLSCCSSSSGGKNGILMVSSLRKTLLSFFSLLLFFFSFFAVPIFQTFLCIRCHFFFSSFFRLFFYPAISNRNDAKKSNLKTPFVLLIQKIMIRQKVIYRCSQCVCVFLLVDWWIYVLLRICFETKNLCPCRSCVCLHLPACM